MNKRTKFSYAGQEMAWRAEWRSDPINAPLGEWVLTWGAGGIAIKAMDEHGQWRGRSGLNEQNPGELGRPRAAPSHWMPLPDPPFPPLGKDAPKKIKERRVKNSEGLNGAI
jgi:hypothetical protein